MSVIRIHKNSNFTVMSNYHFKEKKMSLKAKGLLSLMLSLPDDWNYSVSGLVTLSKDGKDSVMSALGELETFGYLERTRMINNKGQFSGIEYHIYEEPQTEKPIAENTNAVNPILEKTNAEKPPQLNTNKLNTNNNKILKELNTNGSDIDIFEDILKDIVNVELRNLYVDYIEMRRINNKPLTKRGLKMLITRCERLSGLNIREQKQMLEAAIINNWNSVYILNEIKEEREEIKQKKLDELKDFYEG
jgi:hypothetical protein